jgi:hypothetical protein
METTVCPEVSEPFNETTKRRIPDDNGLSMALEISENDFTSW